MLWWCIGCTTKQLAYLLLLVFYAGLDSFAALNVVGHLQRGAHATQQTVIATIHQPRSDIWAMFDSVSAAAALCTMLQIHDEIHAACQARPSMEGVQDESPIHKTHKSWISWVKLVSVMTSAMCQSSHTIFKRINAKQWHVPIAGAAVPKHLLLCVCVCPIFCRSQCCQGDT